MLIGQPDERGVTLSLVVNTRGQAVCQLDDLGRSAHDDMTPQPGETFKPFDIAARERVASTKIDINRG
jgi:hypothetical protein